MNLLIENYNVAQGYIAMRDQVSTSTRVCVSIALEGEIHRFVQDTAGVTVNGWVFEPVIFAKFSNVRSGTGDVADTMDIILDGENVASGSQSALSGVLSNIVGIDLSGKPVHVGRVVLDTDTYEAIAIITDFVGTIFTSKLEIDEGTGAAVKITCASYKNAAHRKQAWVHGDVSHRQRWPGDGAAKHLSDAVARKGKYWWNKIGSNGGGGAYNPYNPSNPFGPYGPYF